MAKYMCIEEYIEQNYTPKSRPTKKTVIRLIKQGEVSGKRIGKFYYINIDAEACRTGNPLVDRVLGIEVC